MKIAFDLDDCVFNNPEFFSIVISSLQKSGHEVIAITDSTEVYRVQLIKTLHKDKIFFDNIVITDKKEEWCNKYNVDYAIDDSAPYYYPNKVLKTPLQVVKIK